jgi:hypothetical protein
MDSKAVKIVIAIGVMLLVAPFAAQYLPKPASFERAKAAFEEAGLAVREFHIVEKPQLGAVAQASLLINEVNVQIYRFDNEGKIATQLGYQQQDPGSAMVESWNIAESLGAKPAREKPAHRAARNGYYMITASGYDRETTGRVIALFSGL